MPVMATGFAGVAQEVAEILRRVADGQTNREIAAALGIGAETVTTVLARTFPRLGVRRRAEAVAYAQHQRLL